MSALRKPQMDGVERLPLLLIVNHEVRGSRPAMIVGQLVRALVYAVAIFGTLHLFHGIARS